MIIRRAQMEALSVVSYDAFEAWLHAHVRRCFPEQYSVLGPLGTIAVVRYGAERARGYGLSGKNDITTYIDLMFVVDLHYDATAWASVILQNRHKEPGRTADRLIQAAVAVLHRDV